MPVMVQGLVNGRLHYWSDEPVDIVDLYGPPAPEHVYLPRVVSIDEVRFGSDSPHGGYVRLTYGSLTLTHEVFTGRVGDWPPPRRFLAAVWYTTKPQATRLFEGTAQLDRITEGGVIYALRPMDEFSQETDEQEYKDTLVNIFTAACADLGLTLDATAARTPSPGISYIAKGKQLLVNNLHHMAKWACHRFWVDDGILYLSDILTPHGTDISLTSRDVEAVEYTYNQPYRKFSADYTQPYMRNLQMVLQEVEAGSTQAVIAEIKHSRAQGGTTAAFSAMVASSEQAGNPVSNLKDGSTATVWANNVTVAPTNRVGDAGQVWLQMAVTSGTVGEYTLTARNSATPTMPSRWDLYGYNVATDRYQMLTSVESTGWGALEERRFPVPVDANWPVEVPGSFAYGEDFRVSPACHRAYSTIFNHLRVIRTVVERPVITLSMPLPSVDGGHVLQTPPALGQRIWIYDTSLADSESGLPVTNGWLHVDGIGYDFISHRCQVYGMGVIASAASVMSAAAVALWRFEPAAWLADDIGTATLTATGAAAAVTTVSIEGDGSAYFSQSDVQTLSVADASLPAGFPWKGSTANRTMTLSMRVRFSAGHAADSVTLASKFNAGGFRLVKTTSGSLAITVYAGGDLTETAAPAGAEWRENTWYHVVLVISNGGATLFGTPNQQWGVCVFDEARDYWLIAPETGTFGSSSLATTSAAFLLGGTSARWYGWVDEVAVYNAVLPLDELILLRERAYASLYA